MTGALPRIDDSNWSPEVEAGFGALVTRKGPLPLKAMDVKAKITGLLYDLAVVQTFVNTHAEAIEAIYTFPLPPRAAVSGFSMKVGNHLVIGELKERGAARRGYQQAVADGKRASLAEEDRPNVFTLSVGNLRPGDVAEVTFQLNGILALDGDHAEWRFPLVVAKRYIPGTPLDIEPVGVGVDADTDEVPDASRLNPPVLLPGFPSPVRLGIAVELNPSGLGFLDLCSTLHAVDTESDEGDPVRRIRLAYEERLNRDFVLRFRIPKSTLKCSAVLIPDTENPVSQREAGDATLMVTLLPPPPDRNQQPAKDVVFVLDRSGSMEGWKITAARRAMARMVDTLGPDDRFGILTFDTEVQSMGPWSEGMLPATDLNRFKAAGFLAKVEAEGGTQMLAPIKMALEALADGKEEREKILFLVTDGQVGNEGRMVKEAQHQHAGCRFQILGIGESANDSLLQRMAAASRGWFLSAESDLVLEGALIEAARSFGRPLVTGLLLTAPGLFANHIVSSGSLDLYPGTPLILLSRTWSSRAFATVNLEGEADVPFSLRLATHLGASTGIRRVWARWKLRDMEDAQKNASDIIAVSLAHGVLCRHTAFLAVDERGPVNPGGFPARLVQPIEVVEDPTNVCRSMRGTSRPSVSAAPSYHLEADMGTEFEDDLLNESNLIRGGSASPGFEDDAVEVDMGPDLGEGSRVLGTIYGEVDSLLMHYKRMPLLLPSPPGPECPPMLAETLHGASWATALAHVQALAALAVSLDGGVSLKALKELREHSLTLREWLAAKSLADNPTLLAFLALARRLDRLSPSIWNSPLERLVLGRQVGTVCAELLDWLSEQQVLTAEKDSDRRFWEVTS